MHTSARDEALLEEIAAYLETLASDCDAMALRGIGGKVRNKHRAEAFRSAAEDIRSIKIVRDEV